MSLSQDTDPKRELRGIWIATVENIDWPSGKDLTSEEQKKEFIDIIDHLKKDKFNAVFVQVRASCDAFYESAIEPWSEWLTGKQGRSPAPFYDPLKFIIDESHKRGIELHVWFNPFRSVMNINLNNICAEHVSRKHPEWNIEYGKLKWLNPGIPEVRDYVLKVIMDVVRRYEIDGVHFDDYFYPYPVNGRKFHDERTFARYSRGIKNPDDWRRDNINRFVKSAADSIRKVKPGVKFGISPFGIWKNRSDDPLGSKTEGTESFSTTYSDSRKWLQEGWVDYLAPQLYWNIGYSAADYKLLAEWWNNNSYGRNIYPGESVYKIGTDKNIAWQQAGEIPSQIRLNRSLHNIKGNIFFNTSSYLKNPLGLEDSLNNEYYKYYALTPQIEKRNNVKPIMPFKAVFQRDNGKILLKWQKQRNEADYEQARYFAIYRFDDTEKVDIERSRNIKAVLYGTKTAWLDTQTVANNQTAKYIIIAMDKFGNESNDNCRISVPPVSIAGNMIISNKNSLSIINSGLGFTVFFNVGSSEVVRLKMFDMSGREIKTLFYGYKKEGSYQFELPFSEIKSKIFIIQLRTEGYYSSEKITLN
ncbi:MAG: family 10 glycosylhydrolase [Ignavibacteriaceae bacterium]|nr:family 10 glycosylhydrolase [Ignavibacteriaceae bacterium]